MKNIIKCSVLILTCLIDTNVHGQSQTQYASDAADYWNMQDLTIQQEQKQSELAAPATGNVFPNGSAPTDPASTAKPPATEKPAEKKYPTVEMTGFFQLDGAFFSQDANNRLTLGTDIEDGLGFRRTRLAAKGNVTDDVSYIIEFDIAQNQARFVDVWMQANDTSLGNLRIGRFRQPFGMDELTSVRNLPFLERTVTFSQSPFRQSGAMLFDVSEDERYTWAVSGYRHLSDNFGNVYADNGGYGMATRLTTVACQWCDGNLLHLGADYSFNDPGRDTLQIISTNEVFVGQNPALGPNGLSVLPIVGVPPFVNSGPIATNTAEVFNLESALAFGRLAIQSEARWLRVDQIAGGTAVIPGGYVQMRYMLTGETIPYVKSEGVFGRIKPCCDFTRCGGFGAWELVGRISHIDLNDGGINGRRLTDFTAGCNWYWNSYTKLQFDYIHSQLDDVTFGASQVDTFALRAQLDF